ncbi:MAG: metallophosphoesterase [Candidatus Parcubacteria bacterium]|nr:metallophosphoesterase [Candidatus Paceibacterota bacterium]
MQQFLVKVVQFLLMDFLFLSPILLMIFVGSTLFWRKKLSKLWQKFAITLTVLVLLLTIWGVHIERNLIVINEQKITLGFKARIVVISDVHLGIWKDDKFLEKIVTQINQQKDIDAVLMAGDWTYEPKIDQLDKLFAPLKQLKSPIYGVLGNHDVEKPGPKLRTELQSALQKANVKLIDNLALSTKDTGLNFDIIGLGDLWGGEDDIGVISNRTSQNPSIVIAHNPESILKYKNIPKNKNLPNLTVTGHTHCGQVRIPLIYKSFLPVSNTDFDKGLFNISQFDPILAGQLWISCGTGEVGLPIRLFNPPSVDVLTID